MFPELKHLSPSSVNSFIENRYQWYRNKIIGDKFKGSIHTCRGTAVEAGINHWLNGDTEATVEANKVAIETFIRESESIKDTKEFQEKQLAFRQSIPYLVNKGIQSVQEKYLDKFNRMPIQQYKITINVPDCKIPVIGYLDWFFPDQMVVDNKVSGSHPKELSQSYKVQGSVYTKATGLPVEFHFETWDMRLKSDDKGKVVSIPLIESDINIGWAIFCRACKAIENIMEKIQLMDGQLLEDLFLVNPDSMWSEEDKLESMKNCGILV